MQSKKRTLEEITRSEDSTSAAVTGKPSTAKKSQKLVKVRSRRETTSKGKSAAEENKPGQVSAL